MKKNFTFSMSKLYLCKKFTEIRKEKCLQKIKELENTPKNIYVKHKQFMNERIGDLKSNSEIWDYLGYICDFAIETVKLYQRDSKIEI